MDIVVTGASRGIGFETVKLFSKDPQNNVFAIARGKEGLGRLQHDCMVNKGSGKVHAYAFNLVEGELQHVLLPEILDKMDKIDILINNAGSLINKPFEQIQRV